MHATYLNHNEPSRGYAGDRDTEPTGSRQHLGFQRGMAIESLNTNGLRNHLDEIEFLLNGKGIHILALNETKLDGSIPKELTEISGYQQQRIERTCNGGGVSLYVKDSIKMTPRVYVLSEGLELLCVEISTLKSKPFLVVAWYRPPSYQVDSFNKLEKALAFHDKESKEIILLGDTNCDLAKKPIDPRPDNNAKHISSLYEIFSFKQLIEEPTRVTLVTVTVIDHVATTCPRNIIKSGVLEVSLSDHYLVYCIRKFNGAVEKGHKNIKTRKMKNFNEEAFLADVTGICWEQILPETDDTNLLVNFWSEIFSLIIEEHAHLIEMGVSENYCPWIDKDLRDLMHTRDKLKKSAVKSKSPILMDSYRKNRNKVNALKVLLQKTHYTNRISACKGNMKESWTAIDELFNRDQSQV